MSDNPFSDSASNIHNIDINGGGGSSFQIDDHTANPFDQNSTGGHSRDASHANPFSSSNGAAYGDLNEWKANLDEREAALNRKTKDLDSRSTKLKRSVNNWPFPFFAVSYHNINDEVLPKYRGLVKQYYYLWIWGAATIIWNWISSIGIWVNVTFQDGTSGLTGFFLASVFLFAHLTLTWTLWYRLIYRACSNEKTARWLFFFINFGLYLGWVVFLAIGIQGTGAYAIIFALDAVTSGYGTWGGLAFMTFGMWLLTLGAGLFLMKKTHAIYRNAGGGDANKA